MFNGWLFRVLVEDALSDGYLYLCELNSNVIYSNSKYILVLRIYIWKIDSLKEWKDFFILFLEEESLRNNKNEKRQRNVFPILFTSRKFNPNSFFHFHVTIFRIDLYKIFPKLLLLISNDIFSSCSSSPIIIISLTNLSICQSKAFLIEKMIKI